MQQPCGVHAAGLFFYFAEVTGGHFPIRTAA